MKNREVVSHTARMRAQYKADESYVLFFTYMDLAQLTDYKLDSGKRWLVLYLMCNGGFTENEAEAMWIEPLLLQWWNLEWRRYDHYVILPMIHRVHPDDRRATYVEMHNEVFLKHHPQYQALEMALAGVMKILSNKSYDEKRQSTYSARRNKATA